MTAQSKQCVGVLHPGAMGASLVAALASLGHRVLWCSDRRSAETQARATSAGADACSDLATLAGECDVIVSVCPPDGAQALAATVAATGFSGTYVDANAISPARSAAIGAAYGARYVDGGIVGPPALKAGSTRLYLSGSRATQVADLFSGSVLASVVLPEGGTAASALKMCYAAWTKGNSALLLSVRGLAERYQVGGALEAEWEISQPGVLQRAEAVAGAVAPKAWRFAGEMREIADTYEEVGLPQGFHAGAAEFYSVLASFKNQEGISLADILERLALPEL